MTSEQSQRKHRRPIRLRDYDYAQLGMYFFTVCTERRKCLFGEVVDTEMKVNEFGLIVWEEWRRSAMVHREVQLDAFVVGATGWSPSSGPLRKSLGAFIAGFKAATTKRINYLRATPKSPVWQRNYYDHVIRDENSLDRIRDYILKNPLQWESDPENPKREGDRPVAPTRDEDNSRYGASSEHGR